MLFVFFFKQKTAYEMRISDWSSDVCSSDLKANLWATIGPEVAGGVVLSGHTDVVPVDGQRWASDPFAVDRRDGRLYGRGTCDMKGFLATALALVPEMVAARLAVDRKSTRLNSSH